MSVDAAPLSRCLSQQIEPMANAEKRVLQSPNQPTQYEVWEELGKGMHAIVYRGLNLSNGSYYALKITKHTNLKKKRAVHNQALMNEASILMNLNHQNVIKCLDAFESQTQIVVVLELIEGGELFHYLSLNDTISEVECINFTRQLLDGLYYIHQKNIAHLDLKDMIDKQLVIVDFSLSRVIQPKERLKLMQGTVEFAAPEIFNFEVIGLYTDMWLTGLSPFLGDNDQDTQSSICQVDVPYDIPQFKNISRYAKELIKGLLVRDGRRRLTAQQAINHQWFRVMKNFKTRSKSMIGTNGFKKFLSVNAQNALLGSGRPKMIPKQEAAGADVKITRTELLAPSFKPIAVGKPTLTRTHSF